MAKLRQGEVRFKGQRAGRIDERPDGSTLFTYDPGWNTPIGCPLPILPNVHAWRHGLHPFFQHLTAEGWLRERQASVGNLDQEDDFGLLLRYGGDCIGAVSLHGLDGDRPSPPPAANLEPATKAAVTSLRTLSGVQKKLLVICAGEHYLPAGPDGPAPYIAKFNNDDIPTLVRNETLTLDLARTLLGPQEVVESTNAQVGEVGHALVVKRFDRTEVDARLRLEDLCQVLVRPRGRQNEYKYDSSYEEAGQAIAAHSVRPEIDRLRFFKLVAVHALLGNCDAHLKNFSLLERPEGLRLAPAYDVVNSIPYRDLGHSTRFALRIDGDYRQHDRVDRSLLITLARNLGLPDRAVDQALADLHRSAKRVVERLRKATAVEQESGFLSDYEQIVFSSYCRIFGDD
ncbi:MAG: type II toxin-antitoxin system HipA family toxin [Dongiaceae bacterium]